MKPGLRVRVNLSACQAYGDCARLCPDVFVLDRYGYPIIQPFDESDSTVRMQVREAQAKCPGAAIAVEEVHHRAGQ